jgi:biopolymer transport protein ExbB
MLLGCVMAGAWLLAGNRSADGAPAAPGATTAPATPAAEPEKPKSLTIVVGGKTKEVDTWEYLLSKWEAGGNTMWFILAMSILALAFFLERLVRLRRGTIAPKGLARRADALWQQGDYDGIVRLCQSRPSTLSRIISYIIKHRDNPVGDIHNGCGDIASREMKVHKQFAYPMAIAATISPLLGLYGTIIGMIGAFEKVAVFAGTGDPSHLAEDISLALITTAGGLLVAMPALFLWHMTKVRTDVLATVLEEETNDLISSWKMKSTDSLSTPAVGSVRV